jgi:hypothetical protein
MVVDFGETQVLIGIVFETLEGLFGGHLPLGNLFQDLLKLRLHGRYITIRAAVDQVQALGTFPKVAPKRTACAL